MEVRREGERIRENERLGVMRGRRNIDILTDSTNHVDSLAVLKECRTEEYVMGGGGMDGGLGDAGEGETRGNSDGERDRQM